jgi:hypothetical protein
MKNLINRFKFTFFLSLIISLSASAQFVQQGGKLASAVFSAQAGRSVSLSADGNTALVGGNMDNDEIGAAWVYTRTNGVWTLQGPKLVGTGAFGITRQGTSVSLSADGNTALVGGYALSNVYGATWVFTRTGNTWTQQGDLLLGGGAIGPSVSQGYAVALSADGNTAIVGAPTDNNKIGAAWIFTRSNGIWTQQGGKIVGTGYIGTDIEQGVSVAISGDGNTVLFGGINDNNYTGAAWVFTRSGSTWTQQGSKLVGTGYIGDVTQGSAVSLSTDGNTALIGGYRDSVGRGASWVFSRSNGVWTQQGAKLVGTGSINSRVYQGVGVSLSGDGRTALIGGYQDNGSVGATWLFVKNGNTWVQQGTKWIGTGAVGAAYQGVGVALSTDGNTAIVGGYGDNGFRGAAWVFTRTPNAVVSPNAKSFISIAISPNPATNTLNIELNEGQNQTINILDLYGRVLIEKKCELCDQPQQGENKLSIDISHLPAGVYIVQTISDGNGLVGQGKFVKL